MQSAATRNARARTAAIADSRVAPYAITPGIDSMSAHHRPSAFNADHNRNGLYGDRFHRYLDFYYTGQPLWSHAVRPVQVPPQLPTLPPGEAPEVSKADPVRVN